MNIVVVFVLHNHDQITYIYYFFFHVYDFGSFYVNLVLFDVINADVNLLFLYCAV